MEVRITAYNALCNLGNDGESIFKKAIIGDSSYFENISNYIKEKNIHVGLIHCDLPEIKDDDYNLRCNRLILKNLQLMNNEVKNLLNKYPKNKISVIAATANSGVEEYEKSRNNKHYKLGNPSYFIKNFLDLKGYDATVSTACSSGIKAISLARDLLQSDISDAVIVVGVEPLSKIAVFGFNSLGVLSDKQSLPFSKNRSGLNIGEACSIIIIEKNCQNGIKIMGIGESSDIYHSTTPDPNAKEAINAIKSALEDAKINAEEVDYINAHGTGTIANDIMETKAIYEVFKDKVPVSSTKPLTGHCLGGAAGIETVLCCMLLDNFDGRLYPHVYDNVYDESLFPIKVVNKNETYPKCKICVCNSFGFGGSNAILVLGKDNG